MKKKYIAILFLIIPIFVGILIAKNSHAAFYENITQTSGAQWAHNYAYPASLAAGTYYFINPGITEFYAYDSSNTFLGAITINLNQNNISSFTVSSVDSLGNGVSGPMAALITSPDSAFPSLSLYTSASDLIPKAPSMAIAVPTSTPGSMLGFIGDQLADPGLLLWVVLAAAIPLFFYVVHSLIGLIPKGRGRKKR